MLVVLTLLVCLSCVNCKLSESERKTQWKTDRNSWPPFLHTSVSLQKRLVMLRREKEIMQLTGDDERWENWMQLVQGYVVPNFTKTGFLKVRTPNHIQTVLKAQLSRGVDHLEQLPDEYILEGRLKSRNNIYGPLVPKFFDIVEFLNREVINELKSTMEEWAGIKLVATEAYGSRLYLNGTTMVMHYDKLPSDIISAIVHVAHEYYDDSDPWLLHIEDNDGVIHAIDLQEGEMLMYESARCLHGRMKPLNGRYYGSLFLHYQPENMTGIISGQKEIADLVPPHWRENVFEPHGTRWAGAAMTIDSLLVDHAPKRVIGNTGIPYTTDNMYEDYAVVEERDDEDVNKVYLNQSEQVSVDVTATTIVNSTTVERVVMINE